MLMKVYAHYEHLTAFDFDTKKNIELTKLAFSNSDYLPGLPFSYFKPGGAAKILISFLKQIPAHDRSYDPVTHIWTIKKDKFEALEKFAEAGSLVEEFISHKSLEAFINQTASYPNARVKEAPRPEDFFYNNVQGTSPVLDKFNIETKLDALFSEIDNTIKFSSLSKDEKIKLYKKAARRFHPDVNNGDATKMTEVNWLWQEYQKQLSN